MTAHAIVLSILTLLLAMKGSVSVNVLESAPPTVDGVLTACTGQNFSLTCRHNVDVAAGITLLIASLPINCTVIVSHAIGIGRPCGPFMLEEVTRVDSLPLPPLLNSTIVATAAVGMTGTNIECKGGNLGALVSIGNISLCIVGQLPTPSNFVCMITPDGLNVTWEPVTDTSCAMSDVKYLVTAIRESDMMTIISSMLVTETTAELTNTLGLQPNTRYIISVSAITTTGGCEGVPGNITCEIYACLVSDSQLTTTVTDEEIINKNSTTVSITECRQSFSTVLAISNIIIGVSTLFIGVIIGVTVTYCINRNSSSQHEQNVSTNVSSDRPMYEEITATNLSKEKFKMEENEAYGPI